MPDSNELSGLHGQIGLPIDNSYYGNYWDFINILKANKLIEDKVFSFYYDIENQEQSKLTLGYYNLQKFADSNDTLFWHQQDLNDNFWHSSIKNMKFGDKNIMIDSE